MLEVAEMTGTLLYWVDLELQWGQEPRQWQAEFSTVRSQLAKHPAAYPEIVVTSSEKGDGIATLRSIIATLT